VVPFVHRAGTVAETANLFHGRVNKDNGALVQLLALEFREYASWWAHLLDDADDIWAEKHKSSKQYAATC